MKMEVILFLVFVILILIVHDILEIWLESICEVPADDSGDVHINKVVSNGSIPHKKTEKQDTPCTEVPSKKIVNNDKLM